MATSAVTEGLFPAITEKRNLKSDFFHLFHNVTHKYLWLNSDILMHFSQLQKNTSEKHLGYDANMLQIEESKNENLTSRHEYRFLPLFNAVRR